MPSGELFGVGVKKPQDAGQGIRLPSNSLASGAHPKVSSSTIGGMPPWNSEPMLKVYSNGGKPSNFWLKTVNALSFCRANWPLPRIEHFGPTPIWLALPEAPNV